MKSVSVGSINVTPKDKRRRQGCFRTDLFIENRENWKFDRI